MKVNEHNGKCSFIIFIFSFALFIFLLSDANSFDHSMKEMGGEPFSDPSLLQKMDKEWQQKPIIHESSAVNADIVISLDQQMFPALKPLIQNYALNNGLKIVIKEGTCGISAGMLSRKVIDIGGFCCAPGRTDRLPGLRFHTLGIASIALIVHPDNPVDNITLNEARRIFMGDYHRWSELSAVNEKMSYNIPVLPVGRLHCKLRAGHWRLLLDNEDLFAINMMEVGAISDMISQVSSNRGAIGYETLWMTRFFNKRGDVKSLSINGYAPGDTSAVISGRYPLYRTYSLTTWVGKGIENTHAQELVDYIKKAVEGLKSKYSFIPVFRLRSAGWKFKGDELVGEPDE